MFMEKMLGIYFGGHSIQFSELHQIECGLVLLYLWIQAEWRGIHLGSQFHVKDETVSPPVEKHWPGNHALAQSVLMTSVIAAVDSHLSAFVKQSNLEEPVPGAEPRGHDDGRAVRRVHLQRGNTQQQVTPPVVQRGCNDQTAPWQRGLLALMDRTVSGRSEVRWTGPRVRLLVNTREPISQSKRRHSFGHAT